MSNKAVLNGFNKASVVLIKLKKVIKCSIKNSLYLKKPLSSSGNLCCQPQTQTHCLLSPWKPT